MSLTAAEIEKYRLLTGDNQLQQNGAYIISDTLINTAHDDNGGFLPAVMVSLLELLYGYYSTYIAITDNNYGTTTQHQQRFNHVEKMLMYWRDRSKTENPNINGLGALDLNTAYYDWPLDGGDYELMKTYLDSIFA